MSASSAWRITLERRKRRQSPRHQILHPRTTRRTKPTKDKQKMNFFKYAATYTLAATIGSLIATVWVNAIIWSCATITFTLLHLIINSEEKENTHETTIRT